MTQLTIFVTNCEENKGALRVAVAHADSRHTGEQIQISPPVHIPQPLHVSLVDEHWFLIVGDLHGHRVAILSADLHHPLLGHTLDRGKYMQDRSYSKGSSLGVLTLD